MSIGVRMNEVVCNLETTSGRRSRVQERRREWGSDEIALFAAIHDAEGGDLLSVYRFGREEVDSGNSFNLNQSMLAPSDSSDSILISIVGYEIDGPRGFQRLYNDKYEEWLGVVGESDFGLSLEPGPRETANGIFFAPFHFTLWKRLLEDDLIILDRFEVESSVFGGAGLPARESYAPSDSVAGLTVVAEYERDGDEVVTRRTYSARSESSSYTLVLSFRR